MLVELLITIPILGLTYLIGWAVWHLLNDEKPVSVPERVEAAAAAVNMTEEGSCHHKQVDKETPATTRLHIPPPYYSSRSGSHTGYAISGMNSGGWSVQHRLVPRHYRRRRWLADELYANLLNADKQISKRKRSGINQG